MSRVRELSVTDYRDLVRAGTPHVLVDVRTPGELALARLEGARRLDDETYEELRALPVDTCLVIICHHGVRSHAAARAFAAQGFTEVHNLTGGIDRWSLVVDPSVPRY